VRQTAERLSGAVWDGCRTRGEAGITSTASTPPGAGGANLEDIQLAEPETPRSNVSRGSSRFHPR
jgi:hypothetical protein